jgi:hypothetical protein
MREALGGLREAAHAAAHRNYRNAITGQHRGVAVTGGPNRRGIGEASR